jgi:exodeoxyribonuclease V
VLDIPQTTKVSLNQGQQEAADGFFQFLFSPGKELILSGPGGVGKTFLMGHLIDEIMPRYYAMCSMMGTTPDYDSVLMTATTNKAAEVLSLASKRPTETIHSFLNLKVKNDWATGQSKLVRTNNWKVHERTIIFVDECSMIDSQLRQMILEGTHNCKIVYVGDHCQLAPVTEIISPIYRDNLPFFELTEPMRNAAQPALMKVCQQLRQSVETTEFQPIEIVPGVIDWADDLTMETLISSTFQQQTRDARILAYTNDRVTEFNNHVRAERNLAQEFGVGELLVNSHAIYLGKRMLSVEDEVEIMTQARKTHRLEFADAKIEVRATGFRTRLGHVFKDVPLPVDQEHYRSVVKYLSKTKQYKALFQLRDTVPDLRPRDAATVHKAQGSTHQTVFLDVGNLSTCHNPDTVARLLYVGFTRAQSRVILYGKLADKYGGLIMNGAPAWSPTSS